jgi:hypothetical protein
MQLIPHAARRFSAAARSTSSVLSSTATEPIPSRLKTSAM